MRTRWSILAVAAAMMASIAQPAAADEGQGVPTPGPATQEASQPEASDQVAVTFGDRDIAFTNTAGISFQMKMPADRALGRANEVRYGAGSYSFVVEPNDTGAATFIEIVDETAPDKYTFEFVMPEGWELMKSPETGAVAVLDESGEVVGGVAPPWAVDAEGNEVETSFAVQGKNKLVQTVNHEGATYPVMADPSVTLGQNVYIWFSGWEIAWWGSASAAYLSAYFCAVWGWVHPVMCAVGAAGAAVLITAFNSVFAGSQCRYVVAFRYWGWPNYMERLSGNGCSYKKVDIPG